MTGLIIGAVVIIAIIFFTNQSNEEKRKIEGERLQKIKQQDDERKRIEQINRLERERLNKIEQQKKQDEEKRVELVRLQKVEEKKKIDEANRLEKIRLQKIEDEKYETFTIVVVGQNSSKYTCVLKRQNNTYAYVERPETAFQLNATMKLLKDKANDFKWISQTQHDKKQIEIKEQKEREEEVAKQEEENKSFNAFWDFVKPDEDYCEILRRTIKQDNSQPFYVYNHIQKLSRDYQVWNELGNGVNILTSKEQLSQYIFSYGKMHRAKLNQAFGTFIPGDLKEQGHFANIIDYGCGQGIGTVSIIDFLNASNSACDYTRTILIEPSVVALQRASTNVLVSLETLTWPAHTYQQIFPIQKTISEISEQDLKTWDHAIKFHIFSNILDIEEFDLKVLYNKIKNTQKGINYFICVSPNFYADGTNVRNQRLRTFMSFFNVEPISHRFTNIGTWTRYEIVFMVNLDNKMINNNLNLHNKYIDDLPF